MSRVFLSHSSRDSLEARALKQWLAEQDQTLASEIFLDVDPDTGIPIGALWRKALEDASDRCEAVICLMSANWSSSKECRLEYETAVKLNKQIFCVRLEPSDGDDFTAQWQRCDLFGKGPTTEIDLGGGQPPLMFASEGLYRLSKGVRGAGISPDSFPWPPKSDPNRSPYRGWEPLTDIDAAVFFGRDAEMTRGIDAIRGMRSSKAQGLFVVLGPSGSGKSSFLRAGLLPRLRRDDRNFLILEIVRPGRAAVSGKTGLAQSLFDTRARLGLGGPTVDEIATACTGDIAKLREWLVDCRVESNRRLLVTNSGEELPTIVMPLDQAEELFTADAGSEAADFLSLINALATADDPHLIVAATIRTDRYEAMQTAPELVGSKTLLFNELKPMSANHFKDVITRPAERATSGRVRVRLDADLVAQLLADCTEGADTLPILSLTLARLYALRGADGRMTLDHYRGIGGMANVVQTVIDDILNDDPIQRRRQLDWLRGAFIPWLATINPVNDQPMRRFARYRDLPPESLPLIEEFVGKRLMVKDTRGTDVVVEVALESLLRQWSQLDLWLRDQRHNLKAADDLERSAAAWRASGHHGEWLLSRSRLTDADILVNTEGFHQRLAVTHDFLNASHESENQFRWAEQQRQQADLLKEKTYSANLRRRSRILKSVLAVTVVVALVAVVGFVYALISRSEAQARTREAISTRLVSQSSAMLAGAQPGGDVRAFSQLLAARALGQSFDEGALYSAVVQRFSTIKIIETPSEVRGVAYSSDGSRMVSAGSDNTVRLWDPETGEQIGAPLTGHTGAVGSVHFSPDSKTVASAADDGTIRQWDAESGAAVGDPMAGHQGPVRSVEFSPDGRTIASVGDDGTARLWSVQTGRQLVDPMSVPGAHFWDVAFAPDGRTIATSGDNNADIRLWDTQTGEPIGETIYGDFDKNSSVAFSPDGRMLVTAADNAAVKMYDPATGKQLGDNIIDGENDGYIETGHFDAVLDVKFSPDGTRVATASADNTVRISDVESGYPICDTLAGHTDWVTGVAFSPDGNRVISGSIDRTIRIWDLGRSQPIDAWESGIPDNYPNSVTFSPGSDRLMSLSSDGRLRLWNTSTGSQIGRVRRPGLDVFVGAIYDSDGDRIVAVHGGHEQNQRVELWNLDRDVPVGETIAGDLGDTPDVEMRPDLQRMTTRSHRAGVAETGLRLWDVDTGEQVGQSVSSGDVEVRSVAFSPDNRLMATGGADGAVRLWDSDIGEPVGERLEGHTDYVSSLAFSADGQLVASGSYDGTIRLWHTDTGRQHGEPLRGHSGAVWHLVFDPEGKRLASASRDRTVRLWDVETHDGIGEPLNGHSDTVFGLAYSPDGQWLASASWDQTIRFWPAVATPKMICDKLTSNMSHEQWNEWVSPDIDYVKLCKDLPNPT